MTRISEPQGCSENVQVYTFVLMVMWVLCKSPTGKDDPHHSFMPRYVLLK
jgi:hypothetical protein